MHKSKLWEWLWKNAGIKAVFRLSMKTSISCWTSCWTKRLNKGSSLPHQLVNGLGASLNHLPWEKALWGFTLRCNIQATQYIFLLIFIFSNTEMEFLKHLLKYWLLKPFFYLQMFGQVNNLFDISNNLVFLLNINFFISFLEFFFFNFNYFFPCLSEYRWKQGKPLDESPPHQKALFCFQPLSTSEVEPKTLLTIFLSI